MDMRANATGIQHLGIPTAQVEQTIAFYEKLGFEMMWRRGPGCPNNVAFLKLHDLVVETYYEAQPALKAGAIDHVAINVQDIEAAFAFCKENGFTLLDKEINFLPFLENGVKFFTILGVNQEKVEFNQAL